MAIPQTCLRYAMGASVKKEIFTREEPWNEHRGAHSKLLPGYSI
ncbi:MAG: hypothetical protein ACTHKA_03345 [Anaerocolumna jejuensis]